MNTSLLWQRTTPLTTSRDEVTETWLSPGGEAFEVRVKLGKPANLVALKREVLACFADNVGRLNEQTRTLYGGSLESATECPICDSSAENAVPFSEVCGAHYMRCARCEHVFVSPRPGEAAVQAFYSRDAGYAATYTSIQTARQRVTEVALPKARWVIDVYQRAHGHSPRKILDIGAGGGHFVKACRDLGAACDGAEISAPSLRFCREHFGLELIERDFVTDAASFTDVDVVTFWGVIEHVPRPRRLLEAARSVLSTGGICVVAVPRWDCLGTFVQRQFLDSIVRHMQPLGHLHLFSATSLLTALAALRTRPLEAWYYGMDAYEFTVQACQAADSERALSALAPAINPIQFAIDQGRLSDEIAVAVLATR